MSFVLDAVIEEEDEEEAKEQKRPRVRHTINSEYCVVSDHLLLTVG